MSSREKKAKRTKRFNVLDAAVLLAVIALIVTAVLRAGLIDRLTFSSKPCTVVLVCKNVDADIAAPEANDLLYTEAGDDFGKVISVSFTTSSMTVTDADGIQRKVDLPSDYVRDIEISVECKLGIKDGRYLNLSGDLIVPGTEFTLHTRTNTIICTVSSISD